SSACCHLLAAAASNNSAAGCCIQLSGSTATAIATPQAAAFNRQAAPVVVR
ncbi:Hypothetical predicted protein, partial [Olea europaea subsp. europaea]